MKKIMMIAVMAIVALGVHSKTINLSKLTDNYKAQDGDVLTGLKFEERDGPPRPDESAELPVFAQTKRWLEAYFSGEIPDFTPPLRIDSTPFCKRVCEILLTIPYGGTETYGAIAETIARERGIPRMAAQAVGGAVHRNPIAIIVPCHRVVGAGGALVGYGGGLGRKSALLEIEKKGCGAYPDPR